MNHYAKAIDILVTLLDNPENTKSFLIQLCKDKPGVVCSTAKKLPFFDTNEEVKFMDDLRSIAKYRKIDAIKRYRAFTGAGLKESKEFIDHLLENQ